MYTLRDEVSGNIQGKIEKGAKGHVLVSEVLNEWETIVSRVQGIFCQIHDVIHFTVSLTSFGCPILF